MSCSRFEVRRLLDCRKGRLLDLHYVHEKLKTLERRRYVFLAVAPEKLRREKLRQDNVWRNFASMRQSIDGSAERLYWDMLWNPIGVWNEDPLEPGMMSHRGLRQGHVTRV